MASMKFLFAVLLLCFLCKGNCQCTFKSIKISQHKTGNQVRGKAQWRVKISNHCPCSQKNVKLSCNGFKSAVKVKPHVLTKAGNKCLLNNGDYVYAYTSISFTYAWNTPFAFRPLSSQVACS